MDPAQSDAQVAAADSQPDEQSPSPLPRTRSRRPLAQPRRYGFACANCHARKVKCNGKQPTCRTCQQSGTRCVWRSSAEKQLRDANSRIRMLEEAVQAATRLETPDLDHSREVGEGEAVTQSAATTTSSTTGTGANRSATSPTSGTSAWFQVGLGHNGAVTYNGPTSRFHASALEEHLADEDDPQVSGQSSDKRAIHVEALRCQYELLDTVWMPLIRSKSGFDGFGIDANVCLALLDMYWNWLQPLHNCVYRPCFMMDMAIGGPYYSDFPLMSIFALSARHLSKQDRVFASVGKGEYFLSRARELLLDEMSSSKPKIPTIQGLLILGGRQCAIGKSSEGWLYTGMAIRMLLDLGLHLHLGNSYLADLERLTATEVEWIITMIL
ncbi:hypothetical protein A0O28_0084020 [Trichoderma guizhouense]|uniref:Zn(2)-C6 fungal-type domain-containing protein n=1 Tax=Trichoderma guizhouense TaxID=1491466 RepID=A0A1T3CNV9_9HYPO|nr:hypothetical protein A0O28_0084020 [Trichoderma guizhouense]